MAGELVCDVFKFRGNYANGAWSTIGPWKLTDTSSSGSPTAAGSADGLKLTLASTSEAENLCVDFGDVLPYTMGSIKRFVALIKQNVALGSNEELVVGLGSGRNDTTDSVSYNAWFKLIGGSTPSLVVETDDNVTDTDDKATGVSFGTSTHRRLVIDFSEEIKTVGAPGLSKGQVAKFYCTDANGVLRRVAETTLFDMSGAAATQGLQPMIQLQKASGTGVPAVSILQVEVHWQLTV